MIERAMGRRTLLKGGAASIVSLAVAQATVPALAQPSETQIMEAIERQMIALIERVAEPLPDIADAGFARFIDRFADSKVILLGESTHGTDEFYRARAAITERLVREHGFNIVALEADWPDAARIDAYVRGHSEVPSPITPFQRFPTWMWRNRAVRAFVDRLHDINRDIEKRERKAGVYGLDLYSLPSSMDAVVDFFQRHDPEALEGVRKRYGCLAPWVDDLATYGALARTPRLDSCAKDVVSVIKDVLNERLAHIHASDVALFDALQNARVVAASEAYYRAMYESSVASWNLRDMHMFETLEAVLEARGPEAKA
ncbi:MAG TPA: erythromycin esterase family protein, partial [Chloroflexota bacterium]|nr:erythromycin esterase family protein [Chloroflexota bacterium]